MWPSSDLHHSSGSSPDGVDLPPDPPAYSHDGRTFQAEGIIAGSFSGYCDDSFEVVKKEIKSTYTGKIFGIDERDMFSAAAFLYVDGISTPIADNYKSIYKKSSRTVFLATSIEVAKNHCARIWMSNKDSFLTTYLTSMAFPEELGESSYVTRCQHKYKAESQRVFNAVTKRNQQLVEWFKKQGDYFDPESIPDNLIGSEHRLVGSLTYSITTDNVGIRGIEVDYVCVRKHYRKLGIGNYLMEHVSAKMKSSTDYQYIKLYSITSAKRFYERLGYDGVSCCDGEMVLHRCKETPNRWYDQPDINFMPTSLGSESLSAPTSNWCGDDDDSPTSHLYDPNSATTSSADNNDDTKSEYLGDYTKPTYESATSISATSNMDTPSPTEPLLRDTSDEVAALQLLSDINSCKTSHLSHIYGYPRVRGKDSVFTRTTNDDVHFKMNRGDEKNEKRKFEDDHSTSPPGDSDEETSYKRLKYEEKDNFAYNAYEYYPDSDDSYTDDAPIMIKYK